MECLQRTNLSTNLNTTFTKKKRFNRGKNYYFYGLNATTSVEITKQMEIFIKLNLLQYF